MITQIPIDRAKRLILLQWLKQGYIDNHIWEFQQEHYDNMTEEEINSEIDRIMLIEGSNECNRLKRLGFCKCNV